MTLMITLMSTTIKHSSDSANDSTNGNDRNRTQDGHQGGSSDAQEVPQSPELNGEGHGVVVLVRDVRIEVGGGCGDHEGIW